MPLRTVRQETSRKEREIMAPGKPVKRYAGTADGRTLGQVINELVDEVNAMTEVLAMFADFEISRMSMKDLNNFAKLMNQVYADEKSDYKRPV